MDKFDELKHPRDSDGKFTTKDYQSMSVEELKLFSAKEMDKTEKLTPEEKIARVHIVKGQDNILPELNEEDLQKIGLKNNKKVIVKANIVERNAMRHPDAIIDTDFIISKTLYEPAEIFLGNKNKPYYTFVKPLKITEDGKNYNGLALLDIGENKSCFEVVHWHWISEKMLNKLKNKIQ